MLRLDELADLLASVPCSYAVHEGDEYQGAPVPSNEAQRLQKLQALKVLDTENSRTAYDGLTHSVAAILDVPICLLSLVAEDRQWFKSKCGLEADDTPRAVSFCAYS